MKPVLFATGHVPGYRVGALACLHERESLEVALFGGRFKHGGLPFGKKAYKYEIDPASAGPTPGR